MKTNGTQKAEHGIMGKRLYQVIGAATLIALLGLVGLWLEGARGQEDSAGQQNTCVVQRGPLTISVLQAGILKAKDPEIIRNSLEGRATIISIIPEGMHVKQGDLLVELDVSTLVDSRIDQVILVKNAEAAYINARETLTITKSQAQSDVQLARLTYEFAQQDLEKYIKGQYPNDLAAAEGKIRLNQEEKEKAAGYLGWSQRLHEEKYLSETQFKADQLALSRAQLSLKVAQNDCNLLTEYTYQRQIAQLTSDVNQARMALERTEAKARATLAQAEAALLAKEQEHQRQQDKLAKLDDQITKGRVYAPADGMVIYATSGAGGHSHEDRQPLADGVEVWERQELIYLPKSAAAVAEVDVREASLQKVRPGLPAVITIDALPGRKFMGTVTAIAPLPDPQSMHMNPDLKIYKTEIALDQDDSLLRSGMNCKAEIIVEQHADTLSVPMQAVLRVRGQPAVFVLDEQGNVNERRIELGLDDGSLVRVAGGLQEAERVLLTPPLQAGAAVPGSKFAGIQGVDVNDVTKQIHERLRTATEAPPAGAAGRLNGERPPQTEE